MTEEVNHFFCLFRPVNLKPVHTQMGQLLEVGEPKVSFDGLQPAAVTIVINTH